MTRMTASQREPAAVESGSRIPPEPEFADANDVYARLGFKRGLLYKLAAEGEIASVVLKRRGYVKAKRLFSMPSIRAFLAKCQEAPE